MTSNINFEDLGLSSRVLDAIKAKGFEEPSEVQARTIPVFLNEEKDIIAQAQTGTGKTAAFGIPLVEMIKHNPKQVSALVLAPTRELAIQVAEEINSLKGQSKLNVVPVYGGQAFSQQLRQLKKGADIIVGTPGRVIDHLNRRTIKLDKVDYLVLDEADEMLNMGFIDEMEEIMKHTNPEKRTLLFSATMPAKIKNLAQKYMKDYLSIAIKKKQLTTNLTEQIYFEVRHSDKFEALCRIIDVEEEFYAVIFCRTKRDVDEVTAHLTDRGYDAGLIHGDIPQVRREKTLKRFKDQKINILVATDVAARGIDVNNLSHVINYSLPQDPESYVHRIGRTGRAGNEGTAITFITPSEYKKLMFIQRVSKSDIKKSKVPNIKEIIEIKKQKIDEEIENLQTEPVSKQYYEWASELLEKHSPADILAQLLYFGFGEELDPGSYSEIRDPSRNKRDRSDRGDRRDRGDRNDRRGRRRRDNVDAEGQARLFVALGRKDKMNPRKLVNVIIKNTGVKNHLIDNVEVLDNFSFISVPFKEAELILDVFRKQAAGEKPLVVKANKR